MLKDDEIRRITDPCIYEHGYPPKVVPIEEDLLGRADLFCPWCQTHLGTTPGKLPADF